MDCNGGPTNLAESSNKFRLTNNQQLPAVSLQPFSHHTAQQGPCKPFCGWEAVAAVDAPQIVITATSKALPVIQDVFLC